MIQSQLFSFIVYVLVGILLGFIYDIFRAVRKSVKSSNLATNIEDIFFVIISFAIIATIIEIISKGELRFYIFLGIVIGTIFYFLSVSKYIINAETWVLKLIIKIIKNMNNLFIKFLKNIKKITLKNKKRK